MSGARYDFPVHPLANVFPDLSPEEFQKLLADIKTHGQIEPIMLSADGETLLDGRHRKRACEELGIELRVERFDPSKRNQSEADFIWAKNVLRRHLTDDQKAAIAVKWSDAEKAAGKERQKQHGGTAPGKSKNTLGGSAQSVPRTRKAIAKKAGVSESKARQAETVAKHRPDLLAKVEAGELKMKDAVKEATRPIYGRDTMSAAGYEKLEHFVQHNDGTAPGPNGKKKAEPPVVNAFVWLSSILSTFEKENFATADPDEVRSRISLDRLEILANCTAWMQRILSAEKAKAAEQV